MSTFDERLSAISRAHIACLADSASEFRAAQPWNELTILDHPGIRTVADSNRNFARALTGLAGDIHDMWKRIARGMMWLLSPGVRRFTSNDTRASYVRGCDLMDDQLNGWLGALADLRHVNETLPQYSGNLTHSLETANASITQMLNEIMTAKGYLARIRVAASESS